MNYNFYYQLLATIKHNHHYLDRYVKFILSCKQANQELSLSTRLENHHVLPKYIFPENSSFSHNAWNLAKLTPRQHFIAHWILWRTFGGKMAYPFRTLKNVNGQKLNSKTYASLRSDTKHTKETKDKISKSLKALKRTNTDEHKAAVSAAHLGKKRSAETVAKITAAVRSRSEATKAKIRAAKTGANHPKFDHHEYTFVNTSTLEEVTCTRYHLEQNYIEGKSIFGLFKKKPRSTCYGWSLK